MPGLLRGGSILAKGLWYVAALRARGVIVANGIRPVVAEEKDAAVATFLYRDAAGTQRRLARDAIAFGFGLSSETQRADLAEIPFAFDPVQQQFLPERDSTGRTPVRGGDETILCRCESVTVGEFAATRALDANGIDRAKAFSRCGMGRCQGRVCGPIPGL